MLGSNLGEKVTAGVVQDQYNEFLKNKSGKPKPLTAEERKEAKRKEMRKRGILVKADDMEETPTIIEFGDGHQSMWIVKMPEKPIHWKDAKKKTEKHKKKHVTNAKTPNNGLTRKRTKRNRLHAAMTKQDTSTKTMKQSKKKASRTDRPIKERKKKQADKSKKTEKTKKKELAATDSKTKQSATESLDNSGERKKKKKTDSETDLSGKTAAAAEKPEKSEQDEKVASKEKIKEEKEDKLAVPKEKEVPEEKEKSDRETAQKSETPIPVGTSTSAEHQKLSSMSLNLKLVPEAEKQVAFDNLDDDEFDKMTTTTDKNMPEDADDKVILKLAPKLLKVAKKYNAMEKCLTPKQNDTLAKFFSGKQPLNAEVLQTLDECYDKLIDYLQKNNCELDDETKMLMKKRTKLKAAMMKEFLVSPQYLPQTWTQRFNQWKVEADKQNNGINWFRIIFEYPKHKSFDDGPEDRFGNFNFKNRGVVLALILGPRNVKTFEETKREELCQGMFLDTRLIETAGNEKDSKTDTGSFKEVAGKKPSATKVQQPANK